MAQRLLLAALCLAVACGPAPAAHAQVSYSPLYQRPAERPALALEHGRLARSPQANAHSPEQASLVQGRIANVIACPRSRLGGAPPTAAACTAAAARRRRRLLATVRCAGASGICGPWRVCSHVGDLPAGFAAFGERS